MYILEYSEYLKCCVFRVQKLKRKFWKNSTVLSKKCRINTGKMPFHVRRFSLKFIMNILYFSFSDKTLQPICTSLQNHILDCYQENKNSSLKCSQLVRDYVICVEQARKVYRYLAFCCNNDIPYYRYYQIYLKDTWSTNCITHWNWV